MKFFERLESYLTGKLLPFWFSRLSDPQGGFTTFYDKNGNPTGNTDKNLIQQTRCIYMLSHVARAGYGDNKSQSLLKSGVEWFLNTFWDESDEGWYWMVDRSGKPLNKDKIVYGHSFVIYALSEYAIATGEREGRKAAETTFDLIQKYSSDTAYGGYQEIFHNAWEPRAGGVYGGDRKSFDVHMHLMEAFTNLYDLTDAEIHHRKLLEVIEVIWDRMIDPVQAVGISQFDLSFQPLPSIIFKTVWGSDREYGGEPRPVNNTSYGHNIEFLWLYLHALETAGVSEVPYQEKLQDLADHTLKYGVDWDYGGIYVEGPADGQAIDKQKEFWQQAEALVGFLDCYKLFGDSRYWDGFQNVFNFVWENMINHELGEWYALLDREGRIIWDYLGHAWKNCYHTVRSVIECTKRLKSIEAQ